MFGRLGESAMKVKVVDRRKRFEVEQYTGIDRRTTPTDHAVGQCEFSTSDLMDYAKQQGENNEGQGLLQSLCDRF